MSDDAPIIRPTTFKEAVKKLDSRLPVTSAMKSREWSLVDVAIRERAFFSARVENARFLQTARNGLKDYLKSTVEDTPGGKALKSGGRERFVRVMREMAEANGIPLVGPDVGGVIDHTSVGRLRLIFETQTRMANEYAYFKHGNEDAAIRRAFPAQRFIREMPTEAPRALHAANTGAVRLKTDLAFWLAMNSREIGGFGVPYGPWGFNSGMGVEDVSRAEAVARWLMKADDPTPPPVPEDGFNADTLASLDGLDSDIVRQLEKALRRKAKRSKKGDKLHLIATSDTPADAPAEERDFPDSPDQVRVIRDLGGTTGARLVEDTLTGRKFVMKRGNNPDHLRAEVAADLVYRSAGIKVPEPRLYETESGPVKLAPFIDSATPLGEYLRTATTGQRKAVLDELAKGFPLDALLANRDVGGTGLDNILVDKDGTTWRIDNGSAFDFRAQGERKQDGFNAFNGELWTMRGRQIDGLWGPKGMRNVSAGAFAHLDAYAAADAFKGLDLDAVLAATPEKYRDTMRERITHSRVVVEKLHDMRHSGWKADFSDTATQHMMGLRKHGLLEVLPQRLENSPGSVTVKDENGKDWDHLRGSRVAEAAKVFTKGQGVAEGDRFFNPLLAALKTIGKHAGDGKYNMATLDDGYKAAKDALEAFDNGKFGPAAGHYVKHADALVDFVDALKAGKKTAFPALPKLVPWTPPAKQEPSAPAKSKYIRDRFLDYLDSIGLRGAANHIDSQQRAQAGNSWRDEVTALKEFWARNMDDSVGAGAFWGKKTKVIRDQLFTKHMTEEAQRVRHAHFALVQEVLGGVELRGNDRSRRAVRLIRTVDNDDVIKPAGGTMAESLDITPVEGLNESGSVLRTTFIGGNKRTLIRAVPHDRITGLYLMERLDENEQSGFLEDGENEFTSIVGKTPARMLQGINTAADHNHGSDASTWGVPLRHLRQ